MSSVQINKHVKKRSTESEKNILDPSLYQDLKLSLTRSILGRDPSSIQVFLEMWPITPPPREVN